MSSFVTLQYVITPTGPTATAVGQQMAAVPVPLDVLYAMGTYLFSDTFPSTATRQLVIALGPSSTATASSTFVSGGTINAVNVLTPGANYVVPPVVSFTGGGPGGANLQAPLLSGQSYPKARAYLDVQSVPLTNGGTEYSAGTVITFVGGLPPALFQQPLGNKDWAEGVPNVVPAPNGPPYAVNGVTLVKSGSGYSEETIVQFEGILQPGGHQAQAVVAGLSATGQIEAVQVIDPGAGYVGAATMFFIDPVNGTKIASNGTQAEAVPIMGAGTPATATLTIIEGGIITAITMTGNGAGYVSLPTVVVFDPNETGFGAATGMPSMGVGSFVVDFPGKGLTQAPTVVLTPYFKSSFPDGTNQALPFYNFPIYAALVAATASQVTPSTPTLS
jgi:hypothetical protein